jgi:hypothetical protein
LTGIIATDLDRTMIYSPKAVRTLTVPGPVPELVGVELRDGEQQSFMSVEAARGLTALADHPRAMLVPTTTRAIRQYTRLQLPGGPAEFAVATNGGTILQHGQPVDWWRERIEAAVRAECAPLAEVRAELERRADSHFVRALRIADDLFCYYTVRLADMPIGFVPDLSEWCEARGWQVSVQGAKVYAVPRAVTKSAAIAELARRHGAGWVVAAGDGALDTDLLEFADAAMRPRHGELEALGYTAPNLRVSDAAGVLAGEEIVHWFAKCADSDSPH